MTGNPYTVEAMRERLKALNDRHAEIHAVADPLRENRDVIARQYHETRAALDAEISAAEAGLAEVDDERALIAIALGARSMPAQ